MSEWPREMESVSKENGSAFTNERLKVDQILS